MRPDLRTSPHAQSDLRLVVYCWRRCAAYFTGFCCCHATQARPCLYYPVSLLFSAAFEVPVLVHFVRPYCPGFPGKAPFTSASHHRYFLQHRTLVTDPKEPAENLRFERNRRLGTSFSSVSGTCFSQIMRAGMYEHCTWIQDAYATLCS